MSKPKYYWIKERHNPQLGTYYVLCGQLTVKEAKLRERSIYGSNAMHKYATEKEYDDAVDLIMERGERVLS
jgi:hypothetical protein